MEKNDAAEQFYHTYYRLIYRTAKRLCQTKEEQEELIQDSLLRFLQNLTYYTNRAPDETSALIVLTIRSQNIDTFRRLHPEKWADWEDEAIEVTASLKREAESRAFRRSEILLLMGGSGARGQIFVAVLLYCRDVRPDAGKIVAHHNFGSSYASVAGQGTCGQ